MKKKNKILILVSLLVVLGIIIIISFAWYNTVVLGNENSKTISVKGSDLQITYVDGPEVNVSNVIPGDTFTKTFSITNTGNVLAVYKVSWQSLENNFFNKTDFVYSITSTNGGGTLSQTQIPNSNNHILIMNNIAIASGVTQSYTITIQYLSRIYNQSSDKGASFTGTIEILDIEDTTTAPEISNGNTDNNSLYGKTMLGLMEKLYPVGSIYTSTSSTNPHDIMGGTWVRINDTFILAAGDTYAADDGTHTTATAGSADAVVISHSHTVNTYHRHSIGDDFSSGSGSSSNYETTSGRTLTTRYTDYQGSTAAPTTVVGESGIGKNMPPYLAIYMWKRTK